MDPQRKKREGRYGTTYERMTSPGRDMMRQNMMTPEGKTKKATKKKNEFSTEDKDEYEKIVETIDNKGNKDIQRYKLESPFDNEEAKDSFIRRSINNSSSKNKTKKDKEGRDEIGSENIDNSYNFDEALNRLSNTHKEDPSPRVSVDQAVIYASGPITTFMDSPIRIPLDELKDFKEDPTKLTVIKIVCGFNHMVVLLDNGNVFVCGDNSMGQLNLDPKVYPAVKDGLMYHRKINRTYEVVDVGCGTNHTVFIALSKSNNPSRKILTCGYHGCLGVQDVNEDEFRLQQVNIPELPDYDKIEFLI